MKISELTVTQLLFAAGLARGMNGVSLCNLLNCSEAYLYKLKKKNDFTKLVEQFKGMPDDKDNLKFKNVGTLYMDIAQFIYNSGEKIKNGE